MPLLFTKLFSSGVCAVTVCLIFIGSASIDYLPLGLNKGVLLAKGSDIYQFYESEQQYIGVGPVGYLVFNGVNCSQPTNLEMMQEIAG